MKWKCSSRSGSRFGRLERAVEAAGRGPTRRIQPGETVLAVPEELCSAPSPLSLPADPLLLLPPDLASPSTSLA